MATHAAGKGENSGPRRLVVLLLVACVACTPSAPTESGGTNVTGSSPASSIEAPAEHPPGSPLSAIELTTEPAAVDLARRVLQGGNDARAALEEAMSSAGLGILDNEGAQLRAPAEPSQGLAFRAYEVEGMARLEEIGLAQSATDLAEIVAAPLPELDGEPVASMVIEDIRDAAAAESPTRRFWAHFLIELGRQGRKGYDLLGDISAQDVSFDGVQIAFILRRLQGDLLRVGGSAVVSLARYEVLPLSGTTARNVGRAVVAAVSTECSFDDIDYNDPRAGDLMFDRIAQHFATGAARLRGAAGIVQAYTELVMAWPDLAVETRIAGPDPFERTNTTSKGDIQPLTSTLRWELSEHEHIVDCMEAAIDYMTGHMGTSLATSGTVPGARFVFSVAADKERIGVLDSRGEFVDFAVRTADEDGSASVQIAGRPQQSDLSEDARRLILGQRINIQVTVRGEDVWRGIPENVRVRALESGARSVAPEGLANLPFTVASPFSFRLADWTTGLRITATTAQVSDIPALSPYDLKAEITSVVTSLDDGTYEGLGTATIESKGAQCQSVTSLSRSVTVVARVDGRFLEVQFDFGPRSGFSCQTQMPWNFHVPLRDQTTAADDNEWALSVPAVSGETDDYDFDGAVFDYNCTGVPAATEASGKFVVCGWRVEVTKP
jgi:hypothetical protein